MSTESIIDAMEAKNKKPDNPVAFPHGYGTDVYERAELGMSLRDYFAAKAMQGLLSSGLAKKFSEKDIEADVKLFYEYATAMLKERENVE